MSRQPTRFGLPQGSLTFNPDFKATKDDKGLWTGSITFTCRMEDVTNLLPENGSPCQEAGFNFMQLIGLDVANNEGGTATVTCKYSGTVSPDYGFDEDDDANIPYTSSLSVATSEEPIETHPRYRTGDNALSSEERVLVSDFKASRLKVNEVNDETGVVTSLITRIDDAEIGIVTVDNPLLQELLGKILKGIVSYVEPRPVYRYNITQKNPPTSSQLNAVGKIGNAQKAPPIGEGRNWLLLAVNYDFDGTVYNISYEWNLSGVGGWDEDLYGEQE
jgi:hypothetical protein